MAPQRDRRFLYGFLCIFGLFVLFALFHKSGRKFVNVLPQTVFTSEAEADEIISIPLSTILSGDPIELPQDDPHILKYIWDNGYMEKPSERGYNLKEPQKDPSMGQGQLVRKLLNEMRDGFFVEGGGLDGETRSNTLYLEKELGWKGLVVEADPSNYDLMRKKNRKAYISNCGLATKPYPHRVVFAQHFNMGKIRDDSSKTFRNNSSHSVVVQCFPLFSLLSAIPIYEVDYFSLDVEGVEMGVLQGIPWDKVFIKILSVEFNHVTEGKEAMQKYMESKNYVVVAEVTNPQGLANDLILVHNSLTDVLERSKEFK